MENVGERNISKMKGREGGKKRRKIKYFRASTVQIMKKNYLMHYMKYLIMQKKCKSVNEFIHVLDGSSA